MRVVVYKSRRLYSLAALVACLVLAVGVCCYSIMSCFAQQEKLLPVYRVRTNEQKIALTFDVAWGDSDLDEILDVLEQNDAKATFFTTGEWLDRCPEQARRIMERGHDIQNHSDQHPHVAQIPTDQLKTDTQACCDKIEALTGKKPTYYRAPYGEYDNEMMQALRDYQVIQWDVDSRDWQENATVSRIASQVIGATKPGSILLFHVDAKPGCTVEALKQLLPALRVRFDCVLLPDLLHQGDCGIDPAGEQYLREPSSSS